MVCVVIRWCGSKHKTRSVPCDDVAAAGDWRPRMPTFCCSCCCCCCCYFSAILCGAQEKKGGEPSQQKQSRPTLASRDDIHRRNNLFQNGFISFLSPHTQLEIVVHHHMTPLPSFIIIFIYTHTHTPVYKTTGEEWPRKASPATDLYKT